MSKDNEHPGEGEAGNSTKAGIAENKDVQRALETILKQAGVESPESSVEMLSAVIAYEGPLPPPAMLEAFQRIDPNLPSEIIASWKSAQGHSQETTTHIVKSSSWIAHTGQWMAFIISLFGLATAAVIALLSDHQWAAAVVGSAALGVPPLVSLLRGRQGD